MKKQYHETKSKFMVGKNQKNNYIDKYIIIVEKLKWSMKKFIDQGKNSLQIQRNIKVKK